MKFYIIFSVFLLFSLISCSTGKNNLLYVDHDIPAVPDYNNGLSWAALPQRLDSADLCPAGLSNKQSEAEADVFFVYPTSYIKKMPAGKWNASVDDRKINETIDQRSIKYQASIFNNCGKIYAPRYRQAHYSTFFISDKIIAKKALDIAYSDVKSAFHYYMDHYNNGRPIILVGHSQGAAHLIRLLKEEFEGTKLANQLVVAYIIGFPVPKTSFNSLKVCQNENQTNCICSWRTFRNGYIPKWLENESPVMITNPQNWLTSEEKTAKTSNLGSVLFDFYAPPKPLSISTQIHKNILWIDKPKFRGSFFYRNPNYHRADLNLFYLNIRENAEHRLRLFWK